MPKGPTAHYVTSLDRVGLAIAAGGVLGGAVAIGFALIGGARDPLSVGMVGIAGASAAIVAIVAVAAPVWLLLHASGRRGPGTAAATAGLLTLAALSSAQAWGGETATAAYRWTSAILTGGLFAIAAAAIGWVMQRIAYRRLF